MVTPGAPLYPAVSGATLARIRTDWQTARTTTGPERAVKMVAVLSDFYDALHAAAVNDDEWPDPTFVVPPWAVELRKQQPAEPSDQQRHDEAVERREALTDLRKMLIAGGWQDPEPGRPELDEELARLAHCAAAANLAPTDGHPVIFGVADLRSAALHTALLVQAVLYDAQAHGDAISFERVVRVMDDGLIICGTVVFAVTALTWVAHSAWMLAPLATDAALALDHLLRSLGIDPTFGRASSHGLGRLGGQGAIFPWRSKQVPDLPPRDDPGPTLPGSVPGPTRPGQVKRRGTGERGDGITGGFGGL